MLYKNDKYSRQRVLFDGLENGKLYPTDIDLAIEFKNKCFIFGEVKYGCKDIPYGQETLLTRMVDNLCKPCMLIHITHNVEDGDIIFNEDGRVKRIYLPRGLRTKDNGWHDCDMGVKDCIERFKLKYVS